MCGFPTVQSLVAVYAAAAKLVSLPLESYRKDQRVLKGMQRGRLFKQNFFNLAWVSKFCPCVQAKMCISGTIAFLRSISLEAVGLGVHLAAGTRDILLQAEYMFTNIPPPVSWSSQGKSKTKKKTNVRHNHPKDAQQGIQQVSSTRSLSSGELIRPF